MRVLIFALAAMASAGAPAAPPMVDSKFNPPSKDCPPVSRYHAMKQGKGVKMQKLTELPPADHYKAVIRRVGACEAPIIAGFKPGSGPRR